MTAKTRSTESTGAAPVLYVALELGSTKWVVALGAGTSAQPRIRTITGADKPATLQGEIAEAKRRGGLAPATPVRSCYEAGRDGFWVHRWLEQAGVANVVVDAASLAVTRRARRAKTDRLDVGQLWAMLRRWAGGERVWSVVRVPTVDAEAQRQLPREIHTVQADRTRVRNRIQGVLATQGVTLALTAGFVERLATVRTGDGRALSAALQDRLTREWTQLEQIETRLQALARQRQAQVTAGTDPVAVVARQLVRLRGIAEVSALGFSAELFGTRTFANGREVGALSGLAPVPYRSDQQVGDQGISRTSRSAVRALAIQVAWGWLRWQPDSALTHWFVRRFGAAGKRSRRIGIVAVARRLLIALWRFVAQGVIPAGAQLKPA